MVVGAAIGRDEVAALQESRPRAALRDRPACDADRTIRPLTIHFRPTDGGMFLAFPRLLRAGYCGGSMSR